MIIQNSAVYMSGSSRFASSMKMGSASVLGWGDVLTAAGQSAITSASAKESEQKTEITKEKITAAEAYESYGNVKNGIWHEEEYQPPEEKKQEYDSLVNVLKLTTVPKQIYVSKLTTYELFMKLLEKLEERLYEMLENLRRGSWMNNTIGLSDLSPTQNFGEAKMLQVKTMSLSTYTEYREDAEMAYSTSGKVHTSDGREIEFDVNLYMSRSFSEKTSMTVNYTSYEMVDPLVISLDGTGAKVGDREFLFDIDMDGELDNIGILAENCGFLSFDRNNDGIINDGSELFGTESGDGFKDLAVFDMDGNGWIDENDEIFNHLRIWTKDADGNDRLIALGVAGIGAIYLGGLKTEFDLKDDSNELQANINANGIYLKENGEAGIIQNVSMALR